MEHVPLSDPSMSGILQIVCASEPVVPKLLQQLHHLSVYAKHIGQRNKSTYRFMRGQ